MTRREHRAKDGTCRGSNHDIGVAQVDAALLQRIKVACVPGDQDDAPAPQRDPPFLADTGRSVIGNRMGQPVVPVRGCREGNACLRCRRIR